MARSRVIALVILGVALLFAVQGGEYSTWNWLSLRSQVRREEARLVELRHAVDSMTAEAHAIETDPWVQERVAREEFGMLRRGEFSYTLESPDG